MAQPQPALPPGLTAVQAGRIGLWLLSRRSHKAAELRVAFPHRAQARTLVQNFLRIFVPWKIYEYPGYDRYLAAVLGIAPSYAHNLLKVSWADKLAPKHARKMAEYLENRASQCAALAAEMRAYAEKCEHSKIYDKRALRGRKRSI